MLNAGLLIGNAIGSGVASAAIGPAGARATMLIAGGGPLVGGAGLLVAMAVRRRRAASTVTAGVTSVTGVG